MAERIRRRWLIPAFIIVNAASVLFFRHMVTLDGPMHVLHAALIHDHWLGGEPNAEGARTAVGKVDLNLGDLLLVPFSRAIPPRMLQTVMVALILALLAFGVLALARAYAVEVSPLVLWSLPFTFSFILLLGVFHFLVAVGVAFFCAAWWIRRTHVRWKELVLLAVASIICAFAHRSGLVVLALLIGMHELLLFITARAEWRERWKALPHWMILGGSCLASIFSAWFVHRALFGGEPIISPETHRPLHDLLTLRTLLLVDSHAESRMRIGFGALLIACLIGAFAHRWRTDRRIRTSDASLLAAISLFIISIALRSPYADLLYFGERAQLVGWLLIAVWLGSSSMSWRWSRFAMVLLVCAHALRMIYIERRMYLTMTDDRLAVEAAAHFDPHSIVIPVVLDQNWLTHHNTAFVALAHNGILLTSRDHVHFTYDPQPPIYLLSYLEAPDNNWQWFAPFLANFPAPRIGHVVVFGHDRPTDDPNWITLRSALNTFYHQTFTNGYATVYTRR